MKNLNLYIFIVVAFILTAGVAFYIHSLDFSGYFFAAIVPIPDSEVASIEEEKALVLEDFAKCLAEKEIKLYGTAWDGHTYAQKELFGPAKKHLIYIECISEEGGELSQECHRADIKGFPLWEFPENNTILGKTSLEALSEISGCPLD